MVRDGRLFTPRIQFPHAGTDHPQIPNKSTRQHGGDQGGADEQNDVEGSQLTPKRSKIPFLQGSLLVTHPRNSNGIAPAILHIPVNIDIRSEIHPFHTVRRTLQRTQQVLIQLNGCAIALHQC